MGNDLVSRMSFETYYRQGDYSRIQKCDAWSKALRIQAEQNVVYSEKFFAVATDHFEGRISLEEAEERCRVLGSEVNQEPHVNDLVVTVRMVKLLCERAFHLSPVSLISIHRRLFNGIYEGAGEMVLNDSLKRLFEAEKDFSYLDMELDEAKQHIKAFTDSLKAMYPFEYGTHQVVDVFVIQYLRMLGLTSK